MRNGKAFYRQKKRASKGSYTNSCPYSIQPKILQIAIQRPGSRKERTVGGAYFELYTFCCSQKKKKKRGGGSYKMNLGHVLHGVPNSEA